jgi:hypothetical protein
VYGILNPPIATVTIIPKSQTVTMTGTLQLGRVLQPLTISQSQTVSTTGKGHQDAKAASGFITFYNGQFQSVTIAAGTILTGASGTQVVTDQDATIQAANPPIFGQVTVSAHVINPGIRGNIPAYDINQACCAASVLAKNTQPFTGGQDERDFQTVTKQDISSVVTPLKTAVAQSVNGAFQGQLKPDEALTTPQCTPSVFSNHKIGDEAASVQASVSETCKVIAYSQQSLQTAASQVMHATLVYLRTPYQLIGPIQTTVRSVSMQNGKPILTATIHGVWVYQVNEGHIKTLVVGKHKLTAIQLLLRLPGVQRVSIDGISDNSLLPDDLSFIHVLIFVAVS